MVDKKPALIWVAFDIEPEFVLRDVVKIRPKAKIGELDILLVSQLLAVNFPDLQVAIFLNQFLWNCLKSMTRLS